MVSLQRFVREDTMRNLLQKDRRKRMQRNEESTLINFVQNKH